MYTNYDDTRAVIKHHPCTHRMHDPAVQKRTLGSFNFNRLQRLFNNWQVIFGPGTFISHLAIFCRSREYQTLQT